MSHLRLTTSDEPIDAAAGQPAEPVEPKLNPGAMKFASFTPMNDQPALADRKATFVIGAGGLLLSTTMFFTLPLDQFLRPGFWPGFTLVLAFCLTGVLLYGMRIAYRCYTLPVPVRAANPLFFQNIAGTTESSYSTSLETATERDALRTVLDFNYTMAALGLAKYKLAGQALLCLRVAIPLWMLLLLVLMVRGAM